LASASPPTERRRPRAHIADDVQLLAAIAGGLVFHRLARRLPRLGRRSGSRLAIALGLVASRLLRLAPRLLLGRAFTIFLIAPAPVLFLEALAVEPLLLRALALGPLERDLRLLLGFALPINLLLLMPRLVLEHLALDVGALAAHFDVHGTRTSLRACELELRLRLAPQRDLARRRIGLCVLAAVAAAQVRQQLMLRILADHVLRAVDLDAGLIELLQQPVDRDLQHLGELRDRYVCHT
jgi:hypothetical protein